MADEDELESAAAEIAEDFDLKGADSVLVTGAWAVSTHGCVTTVAKWLQAQHHRFERSHRIAQNTTRPKVREVQSGFAKPDVTPLQSWYYDIRRS